MRNRYLFAIISWFLGLTSGFSQSWGPEELKYINTVRDEARKVVEQYRFVLNSISHKQYFTEDKNLLESWNDYSLANSRIVNDLKAMPPAEFNTYIPMKEYLLNFSSSFVGDFTNEIANVNFNDLIVGRIYNGLDDVIQVVFVQQYNGSNKINGNRYLPMDRLVTLVIQKNIDGPILKIRTIEPASKAVRMRLIDEEKIILRELKIYDGGMSKASEILTTVDSSYFNDQNYRDIYEFRIKAQSALQDFETALNSLYSDPVESRRVIESLSDFADTSAKIVDDIKPGRSKNKTELLSFFDYMNRFHNFFIPNDSSNGSSIRFSNFIIGKIGRKSFEFIPLLFSSNYDGFYKVDTAKYKPTLKYATIRIYRSENGVSTLKIADIRYASEEDSLKIVNEDREYKLHERFITDRIKNDLLFDSLFAAANKIYLNGSYEDAIQLFEIAATIKPADKVTQQVISNIEEIIQNRDRSKNAAKYLAIADSLYNMKEFDMALDNYEMVIAFDSENVYAKNQIYIIEHRKKKRFPHSSTTYIGVNYNFTEVKAAGIKSTRDLTTLVLNDQSLHQFGLSVYRRFGFHISQIRYSNEPNPSNVYSVAEMDHAHDLLENNGYSDRRMEYLREGYNGYQFTLGFYLSFFRPIHFMVGFTTINATTWDVNLGDYMPVLAPSKGSNTYYTNKVNWQSTELTAGISIVFPYIQTEIIYDNVFKTISLRGGLNIPIVKKK